MGANVHTVKKAILPEHYHGNIFVFVDPIKIFLGTLRTIALEQSRGILPGLIGEGLGVMGGEG